jgi:hypothetical protein
MGFLLLLIALGAPLIAAAGVAVTGLSVAGAFGVGDSLFVVLLGEHGGQSVSCSAPEGPGLGLDIGIADGREPELDGQHARVAPLRPSNHADSRVGDSWGGPALSVLRFSATRAAACSSSRARKVVIHYLMDAVFFVTTYL